MTLISRRRRNCTAQNFVLWKCDQEILSFTVAHQGVFSSLASRANEQWPPERRAFKENTMCITTLQLNNSQRHLSFSLIKNYINAAKASFGIGAILFRFVFQQEEDDLAWYLKKKKELSSRIFIVPFWYFKLCISSLKSTTFHDIPQQSTTTSHELSWVLVGIYDFTGVNISMVSSRGTSVNVFTSGARDLLQQ